MNRGRHIVALLRLFIVLSDEIKSATIENIEFFPFHRVKRKLREVTYDT